MRNSAGEMKSSLRILLVLYTTLVILCEGWCPKSRLACTTRGGHHKAMRSLLVVSQGYSDEDPSEEARSAESEKSSNKPSLWFRRDESSPLTPAQKSLQDYVERIKADLNEGGDFSTTEGVECEGEPSVDPSRQVQSQGDSEWMDDW